MIRILVVHGFREMDAGDRMAFSFIRSRGGREFEPLVACSEKASGEFLRLAKSENIRIHRVRLADLSGSWDIIRFGKFLFHEIFLCFQLAGIIHKNSISMIQVHSFSECLQAIPVSFFTRKPLVWIVQEEFPLRRVPRIFFAVLARFIFRFLAVSRYVARTIRILGVPRSKVQQISIGVPVFEEAGLSEHEMACALVIKGENRHILESLMQALRLVFMQFEHVKFCVGERFPEILKTADLVVYVGTRDPFPMEILEAMAQGVAVVANRSGAIPEIVEDRKSGILVPTQDARSLAKAIIELLSDAPLRRQMGREGRKCAVEHFRPEDQIRAMQSIYREARARIRQATIYENFGHREKNK